MGKIAEIIESGKPPGFDLKTKDERDPDRAVPRAFKQLSSGDVRKFVKETGFSVDHVKRVWEMALAALVLVWSFTAAAADINKGYAFTPTDRVTNTKLNNLVDAATINTTFITDKTSATPTSGDVFLMVRGGTFYKVSFTDMVLNYSTLITGQTEDTQPATGDWLLTYDISASALKKVQLMSVWTNDFLINGRPVLTNAAADTTLVLGYDTTTGTYGKTTLSNLTQQLFTFLAFTNLAQHTAPTNADALLVWDSVGQTNKQISLINLWSNAPRAASITSTDALPAIVAGKIATINYGDFRQSVQPTNFVSYDYSIAAGQIADTNHGIGRTPTLVRWTFVMSDASGDVGYVRGDEVPFTSIVESTIGVQRFMGGANSSNVFLTAVNTIGSEYLDMPNKTNGAVTHIDRTKWRIRCYATP